jgi:hypothetical protein
MNGMRRRRRSSGRCGAAALALAVAGWMGSCPAWAVAEPNAAATAPATVEALEALIKALPENRDETAPAPAELRQIEAGLINLLDRQPAEPRVLDDLADFYGRWGEALQSASPAALRLIAKAADPIGLAWRLHCDAGELGADLLFAALAQRPDPPEVWAEAANYSRNAAWTIVATEESARRLARRQEPEMQRMAAVAAEWALRLDVEHGQLERAAALLAGLPDTVRAEVERGAEGKVKVKLDNANLLGNLEDHRLDLALLCIARGDMAGADRWLAAARLGAAAPSADAPNGAAGGGLRVHPASAWYRVLEAWRLSPGVADDPFDVLTALDQEGGLLGGRNTAAVAVARRGGYPALEERFLRSALGPLGELTPPAGKRTVAPPGIAAAAGALEAAIGDLRARLAADLGRSIDEGRAALGPDPAAATVDRLLRSPLVAVFAEHPLPAGVAALAPEEIDRRSAAAKVRVPLPPELAERFEVVRAERRGRRAAVIGSSLDYGGSGYWVILSSDGGATWSPPLYAGAQLGRDYSVRESSDLPLLAGDHLHLEVARQPSNPGAAGEAAPTVTGIYLDIPLAALERDADGDGLTDLAEERLITDPADPDTDRDGVPDGADTLPQVAPRKAPGAESRAVAALFAAMRWDERGDFPAALDRRTQYWVADRQLFTAVHLKTRIVVLTPEELDLAEEKLGDIYVRYLDLFVLDHAGRRGYAIWTSKVMGETYRFELHDDGAWCFDLVDSWFF